MPGDEELVRRAKEGIEHSTRSTRVTAATGSSSSIAPGAGTRRKGCGWATSASAASWPTECAAARQAGRSFSLIVGETTVLPSVRYVITLDTDTQLPRDAARQMVGTMAHPLNRPVSTKGRGAFAMATASCSRAWRRACRAAAGPWFVRLFAGDSGVDPYTRVVSDVYQDSSAKGRSSARASTTSMPSSESRRSVSRERDPQPRPAGRRLCPVGPVSDVELYESSPRATRGRQPAASLDPRRLADRAVAAAVGPGAGRAATGSNPISALSRWKIFDNLRRSLVPVATAAGAARWAGRC